jgi:hypothetical protein
MLMSTTTTAKKPARAKSGGAESVLAAIAAMSGSDRATGERLHAVITGAAPDLSPKTWYGMPAYARDGKVVCFFRSAAKFGERYVTLGFNDAAKLDDGNMWPIYYALTKLTETEEAKVAELVKKAVRR